MHKVFGLLSLTAALVLLGCGPGEGTNKPAPTDKVSTDKVPPAAAGSAAITPENTKIEFVGSKAGGKHDGGFKAFSGSIKPSDADITKSRIAVTIDTDSIWTDDDDKMRKLTGHLKSPDFFDVKKYPKAEFVSKEIKAEKKDDNTHVITGDLTLHGTTKTVSFPAKVTETPETLAIDSTFTIDRTEFGIAYAPAQVHKEVTIKVSSKVARK
jgi:polyisoprenoid-binding protein YceI